MMSSVRFLVGAALVAAPTIAVAQTMSASPTPAPAAAARAARPDTLFAVSLREALRQAAGSSENLRIAEAALDRASGQEKVARSGMYPQLNGSLAYQRAIQNQFQAITERFSNDGSGNGGSGGSDTTSGGGGGLEDSPIARIFAAPNTVILGLTASQNLFTGYQLRAAKAAAEAGRRAAGIGLDGAKAQLILDVAQAYYDAVAADRVLAIADSTLAQTERSLRERTLQKEAGAVSEFDLLRARVTRENQVPQVVQARAQRDIAYIRLRQLLGVAPRTPLLLTTPVREDASAADDVAAAATTGTLSVGGDTVIVVRPDTAIAMRAPVRQAQAQVEAATQALKAANWEVAPKLQLSTNYQRFGYPPEGTFLPNSMGLFFPNWNVTFGVSFPLFTGGRIGGDKQVARANLVEAEHRAQQAREFAQVDLQATLTTLVQAAEAFRASIGVAEQAAKAYAIAEVRYAERMTTETELNDARLQLQQARLNRVNAARVLELARLRTALIRDLPLTAGR